MRRFQQGFPAEELSVSFQEVTESGKLKQHQVNTTEEEAAAAGEDLQAKKEGFSPLPPSLLLTAFSPNFLDHLAMWLGTQMRKSDWPALHSKHFDFVQSAFILVRDDRTSSRFPD